METNQHTAHNTYYTDSTPYHSDFAIPLNLPTDKGPHLHTSQMAIRLVLLGRHHHFSQTADKHSRHVCIVLYLLHSAGFTLNLKKGKFFREKINYLGHLTRRSQLKLPSHTMPPVRNFKPPLTVDKRESFLGLRYLYRCFAPSFTLIAALFDTKQKKGT